MYRIVIYLMVFLSGSIDIKENKKDDVRGYRLTYTCNPGFRHGYYNGEPDTMFTNVLFWKNQILYESDHVVYYRYKDTTVRKLERFVLVREKNSDKGFYYDVEHNKPARRVSADSLISIMWISQTNPFKLLSECDTTKIFIQESVNSNTRKEIFRFKGRGADSLKSGTIELEYQDSIKKPLFSLSNEIDSIRRRTLSKLVFVNDPKEFKGYNYFMPKVVITYTLEEIKQFSEKRVFKYFIEFKKKMNSPP